MNSKKIVSLILPVAIIAGVSILLIFANNKINHPVPNNYVEAQNSTTQKWETKVDTRGEVTIAITPLELSTEARQWKFNIVMDTHSIELDQDMTKFVVLIDNQGKEYKPLSWEGSTGGHHREGVLTFSEITPIPKSIKLKISGVGDVVRIFDWQL